jgi:hypothetical protein
MSDDSDVFGKADALLRRHTQPRVEDEEGADVPVLTELITPGIPQAAPATLRRDDEFTRELVAKVVKTVESRLAQDLERRLTQHLVSEVQASVASTLGDLRQDIANAVGDAVAEALSSRYDR